MLYDIKYKQQTLAGAQEDRRIRESHNKAIEDYYNKSISIDQLKNKIAADRNKIMLLGEIADRENKSLLADKYRKEAKLAGLKLDVLNRVMESGISDPNDLNAGARSILNAQISDAIEVLQGVGDDNVPYVTGVKKRDLVGKEYSGLTKPAQINISSSEKSFGSAKGKTKAYYKFGPKMVEDAKKRILAKLGKIGALDIEMSGEDIPQAELARELMNMYRESGYPEYEGVRLQQSSSGALRIVDKDGKPLRVIP